MAMMPVVVGVDGSAESLRAVEWAALEARRHRAPLRIVAAPTLLRGADLTAVHCWNWSRFAAGADDGHTAPKRKL